jgi:peptidoglycan/LPS O-acetylase OafA/YrhL
LATDNQGRVTALEALRGWAAMTVVFGHCLFGFGVTQVPLVPDFALRVLVNAHFAVIFFFTLSGFVLTRRYFADLDENYLVAASIKRWPRLALLTLVACLISWALRSFDLYWCREAGGISNSLWLSQFALFDAPAPYKPDLATALSQGAFTTFLFGKSSYDPSMWTMQYEFYGSFIAFSLAYAIGRRGRLASYGIGLVTLAAAYPIAPYLACFVAGTLLAGAIRRQAPVLLHWLAWLLLICAIALPGMNFQIVGPEDSPSQLVLYTACSLLAVSAISLAPSPPYLTGRVSSFLGRISFPLYLIHFLVLCSLGSFIFVIVPRPYATAAATFATIAASVLISIPLAEIDRLWLSRLNPAAALLAGNFCGSLRQLHARFEPRTNPV